MKFYNGRGMEVQWIKEGKYSEGGCGYCAGTSGTTMRMRGFSSSPWRTTSATSCGWSLTTLREKLIKIGAKTVRRAPYVTFQMAEVAVVCELFATILEWIR